MYITRISYKISFFNIIGIGIQGLADAFILMRYPFDSKEANELNVQIFETLYYGALEASCEIAIEKGSHESYEGSPVSKGVSRLRILLLSRLRFANYAILFFSL